MAPAVGLGHAATALSLLALGLNVETRFRAGGLLTAQLSKPEVELAPVARRNTSSQWWRLRLLLLRDASPPVILGEGAGP